MTIKINALSDADVAVLQELVQAHRARKSGANKPTQQVVPPQAPEVYIAKTPVNGIPAAPNEWTGTSTGSSYDLASSAVCNVYQLVSRGSFKELHQVPGLTRVVHNMSGSAAVPRETYVKIERDKFGTWWVSNLLSPECSTTTISESDLRCENGNLNLYTRSVTIMVVGGCLVKTTAPYVFVKTVACCDASCVLYWWCLSPAGDTGTGTFGGDTGTGTGFDNASCYQLTTAAKTALLAQGWIQHAGPFISLALCQAACDIGTGTSALVEVGCCPGKPLPTTLYGTITNKTGNCTCYPDSMVFVWNPSTERWETGEINVCVAEFPPGTFCAFISCEGTVCLDFKLRECTPIAHDCFFDAIDFDSCSCDPFVLTVVTGGGCCDETMTLTITE